jgi:hypothetical protein
VSVVSPKGDRDRRIYRHGGRGHGAGCACLSGQPRALLQRADEEAVLLCWPEPVGRQVHHRGPRGLVRASSPSAGACYRYTKFTNLVC